MALPERLIPVTSPTSNGTSFGPFLPELARRGIELIAPTGEPGNSGRKAVARFVATDGGGATFVWLQNFRRIVVRYERVAENFPGMLHLACRVILLRGL